MSSMLVLLLTATLTLTTPSLAGAEEPPVRIEGRFFTVVGRGLTEAAVRDAVETADAAWPYIREVYDSAPKGGFRDRPVIQVHRTVAGYEQAEYALTRGRFKEHLAFSSWETWESHIAVQPYLSDDALLQAGLPGLTRQQIAHEATHLASYREIKCYKQLPAWMGEGAACYVARRTLIDLGYAVSDASDPESSKDILRVREMIARGTFPSMDGYLSGVELQGDRLQNYAFWGVSFEFLMSPGTGSAFRTGLRELSSLNLDATADDVNRVFRNALTTRRIAGLDNSLRKYLESKKPGWDLVFRSLDVLPDRWFQGTLQKNSIAWRLVSMPSAYKIRGRFKILPGETTQLNLLLARHGDDMIQVCFVAGNADRPGMVTVFDFRADLPDAQRYRQLAQQICPAIQVGREVPFEALVNEHELLIRVDDADVVRVPRQSLDLSGAFGVGALRGSSGIWRQVEVSTDS